ARVRRGNILVSLLRGGELIIVHQILGQRALHIQVVGFQVERLFIGRDGALRILLLVVAGAQNILSLRRLVLVRQRAQHFDCAFGIALAGVQPGQIQRRVLRAGIDLLRRVKLRLGLCRVMREGVELAQDQVVLNVLWLKLNNFFKFVDGQLQNLGGRRALLIFSQRAQVYVAQQLVGVQV